MNPAQLLDATVVGDGPRTVVFGNGFATTQRAWDAIVPHVPAGWRIVRFDYVGTTSRTAEHWIPERYRGYEGHADDLCRLLAHLEVRQAVFVGHSMSGMIGTLASLRAPERFGHLIMIGASACYMNLDGYHGGLTSTDVDDLLDRVDADVAAWMAGFSGALMGRDASRHQLHEYLQTLLAMRPDISRTMLHSFFRSDYRDILSRVAIPTTIVQSTDDVAVPVTAAEFLAARTPSVGLHVLPVSGHLPHITHPALVWPIVCDVLNGAERNPGAGGSPGAC